MSAEYYEPWTPAVGDRVRVRLSPECPGHEWIDEVQRREIDGQTGTVTIVFESGFCGDVTEGHRFFAAFDSWYANPVEDNWKVGILAAAIELEPLIEPTPGPG